MALGEVSKCKYFWTRCLWEAWKIFCASLDHTVCFRRLFGDHAHPTKCAGWSHDAPIIFYWRKRGNTVIFAFWYSFKSHLPLKNIKIAQKVHVSEWRRWLWEAWKNFLCVFGSYCLLSETSLGPCASNKVREVITWRTNPFLLTQTWELIDFCILMIAESCFWRGKMW